MTSFSTDFTFFDFPSISFFVVEGGSHRSHRHFLSLGNIRRTTNNLHRRIGTDVYLGYAQTVGIGVLLTSQDFSYYNPC